MVLTQEQKDKNKSIFFSKLSEVTDAGTLEADFGSILSEGTFSHNSAQSLVGDGTLINTVLRKLTPMALKINETLPEEVRIDKKTIIKICLLNHISKAIRLIQNDNEWEVSKRGIMYKYNNNLPSIKTGLHSLIIAQESGIKFTAEEAEAMTINDREPNDEQAKWHSSLLANIIKTANELVYLTEIQMEKQNNMVENTQNS